jgi:hypothetical protein
MKKRFLLVMLAVLALLSSASFAYAAEADSVRNMNIVYGGIIAMLVIVVAVVSYVVITYLKRK